MVVVGAVAALVLCAIGLSLATRGQAAPVTPEIEVSNSCAVLDTSTTLTIWGSDIRSGPHRVTSALAWFPSTTVTPDALGNFTVSVPYAPSDTAADRVMLDQTQGPPIQVVSPGGCPTSTPPAEPCVATGAAVPVSVSDLPPATEAGAASWYLDYPGAGSGPASFATATVTAGATSAVLPGGRASPGTHQITVMTPPAATGAVIPPVYWTYPITFCIPAPDTSTTVPSTTTTSKAPASTAPAPTPSTTVVPFVPLPSPSTPTTTQPGATPHLAITPQVASGGDVTQVHGVGFPPNSAVILVWQPGIGLATAQVGPDGTFTTPFLIMPRDQTGPRVVQASGYPPSVAASLLVEPGPSEPPAASGQWVFRRV